MSKKFSNIISTKISIAALTTILLISIAMATVPVSYKVVAQAPYANQIMNINSSNGIGTNTTNTTDVTLNLKPVFIEVDKVTGQSKVDDKFNVTFSGNGTIRGLAFNDTGFALITPSSDGFSRIQGTVHITSKIGGEKAIYDLYSIGHTDANGILKDNGIELFSTNSKGKMAFVNNMVIVFTDEVNQSTGNGKTIGWELNF